MMYGSQITTSDISLVEDYVDTFLSKEGYGPEKTESIMRFISEKKDKDDGISLKDIDPTVFPMIRKAMIRYPTAKNDLEALVKLVQDEMKKEQNDITRLDKENDVQDDDIEGLDGELSKDTELTRSNRNLINTIMTRIDALEKNVEQMSQQPTQEGYDFIREEEPLSEIADNSYSKDAMDSERVPIKTFRTLVDQKQITIVGKIGDFIVTLDGYGDEIGRDDIYANVYKATDRGIWHTGEIDLQYQGTEGDSPVYQTYETKGAKLMQGKGIMGQVYLMLSKKFGWVIASGDSQSPGAQKMWKRIVANPSVMAWTETETDGKKHELYIDKETGELEGLESVYGSSDEYYHLEDELDGIIHELIDQQNEAEDAYEAMYKAGEISKKEYHASLKKLQKRVTDTISKYEQDYGHEMQDNEFGGSPDRLIYFMWVGRSKKSFKETYESKLNEMGRVSDFVQTDDVSAPEVATQAKKWGFETDADGYPPLMNGSKQKRTRTKIEHTEKEYDSYVVKEGVGGITNVGVSYANPQFDVEWEEANRYPYLEKLGPEGWEELAKTGRVVRVTTDSVKKIGNTGADGSESLDDLEPEKVARLKQAMDSGTVEMPIVVKQPDGSLELIAGNTRLIGLISTQGEAQVWFVDASTLTEGVGRITDYNSTHDVKKGQTKKEASKMAAFRESTEKKSNYVLQLERDDDMMILHITQSKTGHRTEVRGKAGYEIDGYDPNDPLHQLLDKIGKVANFSDLMNGTKVSLNPVHPDYPKAKEEVVKMVGESDYSFFHEDVDWSKHHWNAPNKPYAKTAEMVPVAWLEKLVGNDLRTYDGGAYQNIGYNPDTDDWDMGNLEDLAKSMKERGIQEPVMIVVGMKDGWAYVGEGNHRIAAAKLAGIKALPARVYMQSEIYGKGERGQHRHDMTHDITWNPAELEPFSKVKYYDKPSQVFKSLQK